MAQLTSDDIVVVWRGSNDVARNNTVVGMKHRFVDKLKPYKCDPAECTT
jgi:hypothetical protein